MVRRINAHLISRSLFRLIRSHHISDYSLMTTYPAAEGVFIRFPHVRRLYYCADEYTTLPGLDPALVRSLEDSLLGTVDVVITPSRALHDSKSRLHPNVVYLPHGVDFDHFAATSHPSTSIPSEIAALPRPVIGFHGLVQELIDFDMIDAIARERPTWSIVLVGRRNFDAVALPKRPNIHYLGDRTYSEIPRYLKGFDVCLIPYRLVPRTLYANPVKLREYLATGKPIVSTPLPEVLAFGDLVEVATTAQEFLERIERCLRRPDAQSARRMTAVRDQTWASRAAVLHSLL